MSAETSPLVETSVFDALLTPHVSFSLVMVVLVVYRARKARRWPSEGMVIELLAYSSGIYAAILLGKEAGNDIDSHSHMPWVKMAGAIVLFQAALKGCWRVLLRLKPEPPKLEPTVATVHDHQGKPLLAAVQDENIECPEPVGAQPEAIRPASGEKEPN